MGFAAVAPWPDHHVTHRCSAEAGSDPADLSVDMETQMRSIITGIVAAIGTFAVLVLRGALLWIVLPLSSLAWAVMLLPGILLRLVGLRLPLNPAWYLRFGTQILDACLTRTVLRAWIEGEPWHGTSSLLSEQSPERSAVAKGVGALEAAQA